MTIVRYFYFVVSLVVLVLGAAVIGRIVATNPRAWRSIIRIAGIVFVVVGVAVIAIWLGQVDFRAIE